MIVQRAVGLFQQAQATRVRQNPIKSYASLLKTFAVFRGARA